MRQNPQPPMEVAFGRVSSTRQLGYSGGSKTSDATVFEIAQSLIDKHGDAALMLAFDCVSLLAREKDLENYMLWQRILRAVFDLVVLEAHQGATH